MTRARNYATTGVELEWFGGNKDAYDMVRMLGDLSHTWDDLVDGDERRSEQDINAAFLTCLVYLPMNPFYRAHQAAIIPMWVSVVASYEAANRFERDGDAQGLEIGHVLRYLAGHIATYAIVACVGQAKASDYVAKMWKAVVGERVGEYIEEHRHAQVQTE